MKPPLLHLKIKYRANNSGGSWWLTDDHWKQLERADWFIEWGGVTISNTRTLPKGTIPTETFPSHRKYNSREEAGEDRWMGALSVSAEKIFIGESVTECVKKALQEFEKITGMDVTDEGCSCCGAPHRFYWNGGGCDGEDCSEHLFGKDLSSLSKRELYQERVRLLETKKPVDVNHN